MESSAAPQLRGGEEIASRISELAKAGIWEPNDLLGFKTEALAAFLPWEHAKALVKPTVTEEEWTKDTKPLTREAVIEQMRGYMEFAWGKAKDERGISASRSVEKLREWAWLLGDDDLVTAIEEAPYGWYGVDTLRVICERLDFPIPEEHRR